MPVGDRPHRFDPVRVGRAECAAWVAYYRRDWPGVLTGVLGMVRLGVRLNDDDAQDLKRRLAAIGDEFAEKDDPGGRRIGLLTLCLERLPLELANHLVVLQRERGIGGGHACPIRPPPRELKLQLQRLLLGLDLRVRDVRVHRGLVRDAIQLRVRSARGVEIYFAD